ncbi:MAG: glycosyl hydrolase, partial [Chthonomonadales bacterium]
MIKADPNLKYTDLLEPLHEMWRLSGIKIEALQNRWNPKYGPPVVTRAGKYTSRTWTSWTEGFVYGSALLQFDATSDQKFLELGRRLTFERMPNHLTDRGVHDHGFNNVSTYGNLWRMTGEGNSVSHGDREVCELALRVSGAVQAMRWTNTDRGHGFIHSFNGPQSLFVDTIRSLRSLAISHKLGHVFIGEQVQHISLLERLVHHALVTAQFSVYYGKGRDVYDVRGRTAHEILFNPTNGTYRA